MGLGWTETVQGGAENEALGWDNSGNLGGFHQMPGVIFAPEDLKNIEDREFLTRTAEIAKKEREVTVNLLRHLHEVERRQLYLEIGYPSLYEYVIKELKFSEGAGYRRIQAMRLIRDLPEAAEKIVQGQLTLCNASKVQKTMRSAPVEEKLKLVEALEGKSTREADRELAKLDPKGPREFTRWLSQDEVQLTFSLDRPTFSKLDELQSLRTHVDIKKTYKTLVTDLVRLGQEKWNPLRRSVPSAVGEQRVNLHQVWKTVPPTLRREIWQRDKGVCSYKVPNSEKVCGSRDLLQIDHIHPLALGGKNEHANLRLLCAAHNQSRADKTYGPISPQGAYAETESRPGYLPDP